MRTLQELAREAIQVQDACNLSGVVKSWGRALTDLREFLPHAGTEEINTHPVNVLWASKVCSLIGCEGPSGVEFGRAYEWAKRFAEGA